ncbi:sulfotransferase family protein [Aspergillus alliaceus]|uniref:sulfotransferase family protein n=1 Tax=Petromyces alliaceus TaxID=209559 RepID=UPI0012A51387|nr:uncharacterized protein BDW43DRAFT_305995 [Aspergillus alliaceus]KAB8239112.1 hypothetical protein BDW43DRAFT_305995 [Aspergillus alliaceus]
MASALREALRTLGYANPYHGYSCLENPDDCVHWYLALSAKYDGIGKPFGRKEFDTIIGECQALCGDFPVACFGPELIKAYPEAKVILTYRDVEEWHQQDCTLFGQQSALGGGSQSRKSTWDAVCLGSTDVAQDMGRLF